MEQSNKISALAITLNEAEHLEQFIKSLWFVDEIIIVDSFSEDDTVAIASKFDKVTVVQREFDNFSDQKNFAISQASSEWLVFFDPDEEISREMGEEILATLQDPKAMAYAVKRELYFMGKRIKYSGFQTDWVIRLFHKEHGRYNGNLVHETLMVSGTTAKLKTRLPHHTYKSFDDYTAKLHRYSALQARMMYEKRKRPNLFHFLFRPLYRFWHQYLLRLGILDGKEGFILAYINAFSVFKRYVNLWLLYRKIQ
ncbi:MAG: glycosyltransferase family 2 protein [Flavobacteriaceae bacterium]|nr:glycosyltransferase family 2 protein [Flavobacteriaceae bacterium]